MSLDFKLCFASLACIVGIWVEGSLLAIVVQLLIAMMVAALGVFLSVRHRRQMDWRWPGTNAKGVLRAVGAAAAAAVMFFVAHPMVPFFERGFLGWYLAGVNIAVFNILESLHFVQSSEAEFLKFCGPPRLSADEGPQAVSCANEPFWQRASRAVFGVVSAAVMIEFLTFFYLSGVYFRSGAPNPTSTQTERIINRSWVVYITPMQKHLLDRLETGASICIPAIIGLSLFLHFIVGVKLHPNTPTLREICSRKNKAA
jgi:hypothetical protein